MGIQESVRLQLFCVEGPPTSSGGTRRLGGRSTSAEQVSSLEAQGAEVDLEEDIASPNKRTPSNREDTATDSLDIQAAFLVGV